MKKHPFFFILCLLLLNLISCTDGSDIEHPEQEITTRAKPTKVTICHYNSGNGTYKTRTVNEKQVDKHLEHGDYLGACEDAVVCDPVCLFCDYINLMDFDEPCPEIPFDGDVYCSTFVSAGCPGNPEAGSGETYLWDRDLYRNLSPSCGSDDENDSGYIGVFWEIGCDGSLSGQVTVFYDEDGDNVFEIDLFELGATEEAFNNALYCKSIIDNLASDLGYSNACTIEEPPCDPLCLFCEYINLMDFDEPCPEIPFDGDVYCSTFVSAGCPGNPEAGSGETYLWDRDLYRNLSSSCGSDDENDSGYIGVSWEIGCDGSLSGQVTVFYDADGDNVFEIDLLELGATEEDFNKALYCKSIIDNLAADLGYISSCGD